MSFFDAWDIASETDEKQNEESVVENTQDQPVFICIDDQPGEDPAPAIEPDILQTESENTPSGLFAQALDLWSALMSETDNYLPEHDPETLWASYAADQEIESVERAINGQLKIIRSTKDMDLAEKAFQRVSEAVDWVKKRLISMAWKMNRRDCVSPMLECLHGKTCKYLDFGRTKNNACMKTMQPIFSLTGCPEGKWSLCVPKVAENAFGAVGFVVKSVSQSDGKRKHRY